MYYSKVTNIQYSIQFYRNCVAAIMLQFYHILQPWPILITAVHLAQGNQQLSTWAKKYKNWFGQYRPQLTISDNTDLNWHLWKILTTTDHFEQYLLKSDHSGGTSSGNLELTLKFVSFYFNYSFFTWLKKVCDIYR